MNQLPWEKHLCTSARAGVGCGGGKARLCRQNRWTLILIRKCELSTIFWLPHAINHVTMWWHSIVDGFQGAQTTRQQRCFTCRITMLNVIKCCERTELHSLKVDLEWFGCMIYYALLIWIETRRCCTCICFAMLADQWRNGATDHCFGLWHFFFQSWPWEGVWSRVGLQLDSYRTFRAFVWQVLIHVSWDEPKLFVCARQIGHSASCLRERFPAVCLLDSVARNAAVAKNWSKWYNGNKTFTWHCA